MGPEGPLSALATHLAEAGSVVFGPVEMGAFRSGAEAVEYNHVLADGLGGMWAVQSGSTGDIQHVDALGRPTYWEYSRSCPFGGYRRDHSIIRYEDDAGPDAALDAAVDVSSDAAEPPDAAAPDANLDVSDELGRDPRGARPSRLAVGLRISRRPRCGGAPRRLPP